MNRLAFSGLVFSLLLPTAALAQAPTVAGSALDLAVPESPAFTILSLNPQDIVRPVTPASLVTTVLNGVDKAGTFQSGFAIDTAPYMLWKGPVVTLADYQQSAVTRFITRLQVSAAVVKGATEGDKSARLGLGVHATLFDLRDPRMDRAFLKELAAAGAQALIDVAPLPPGATDAQVEEYQDRLRVATVARARTARELRRKTAWNPTSLLVGAAAEWQSPEGRIQDMTGKGSGVWASLGYGFDTVPGLNDSAHLVVHARFRNDVSDTPATAGPTGATREKWLMGGRLRMGGENGAVSVEMSRTRPMGSELIVSRFTAAVERRVLDKTWIELAIGGQGDTGSGSTSFVLTQLKWSLVER